MLKEVNWGYRKSWPFSGPRHAFIAEVANTVGTHFFSETWTGNEFWFGFFGERIPEFPKELRLADTRVQFLAIKMMQVVRPEAKILKADDAFVDPEVSEDQWAEVQEGYADYLRERQASRGRINEVFDKIRQLLAREELVAALKNERSGEFITVPPERWNTDHCLKWLRSGQVSHNEAYPDFPNFHDSTYYYLFVEREGLERFSGLPEIETDGDADFYQSDFLRFLNFAARQLTLDPENPQLAKTLAGQILDLANEHNYGITISSNMAENMATILRGSEVSGGKASPKYKERQKKMRSQGSKKE